MNINKEDIIERLQKMPIEEVEAMIMSALDATGVEYTFGEGSIEFNGLIQD